MNIEFKLYAISMKTTIKNCHNQAPLLWKENLNSIKGKSEYGLLEYDKTCSTNDAIYYIASKEKFETATVVYQEMMNYQEKTIV